MSNVIPLRSVEKITQHSIAEKYEESQDLEQIREQLRYLREISEETNWLARAVHTRDQPAHTTATAIWKMLRETLTEQEPVLQSEKHKVGVSALYERGAVFVAAFCITALVTWFTFEVPLLHPILSFVGLIAAPFIYFMGRISRMERK